MKEPLNELAHRDAARLLIQSYLSKCSELSVQTWLMGGSLLGWWWGKKVPDSLSRRCPHTPR